MLPQNKILLILGRECLRIRKLYLQADEGSDECEMHRQDLFSAWSIFRFAYTHYYHNIPRFQLRFY